MNELDSLPDQFGFAYEVSEMYSGYYGHAMQLFQKIKEKQVFEPQYSSYLKKCTDSSATRLTSDLAWGDTLVLQFRYDGCFGTTAYRYDFIKRPVGYQAIFYERQELSHWGNNKQWKIRKEKLMPSSYFVYITSFEKAMRDYFPNYSGFSTTSGYYSIKTRAGRFDLFVMGLLGYDLEFQEIFDE